MTIDPLATLPRYDDKRGASVPITGRWCPACAYPMHPALQAATHPNCVKDTP